MRTHIIDQKWGGLTCRSSRGESETFYFPTSSIPYWYPFDLNYEYYHKKTADGRYKVYLSYRDTEVLYPSYGIVEKKGRNNSDEAVFYPEEEWKSLEVFHSNYKVMLHARKLGVITFTDLDEIQATEGDTYLGQDKQEYLKKRIWQGFHTLYEAEQELKDRVRIRALDHIDLSRYERTKWEDQDTLIYQYIREDESKEFARLGYIRNMLCLIQKVVKAGV